MEEKYGYIPNCLEKAPFDFYFVFDLVAEFDPLKFDKLFDMPIFWVFTSFEHKLKIMESRIF